MFIQSDFIFSCEFSASEQWRIILHVLDMQLVKSKNSCMHCCTHSSNTITFFSVLFTCMPAIYMYMGGSYVWYCVGHLKCTLNRLALP